MRGTPTPVTVAGIAAGLVLVAAAIAFGRVDAAVAGVLLIVVTALAVPGGDGDAGALRLVRAPVRADQVADDDVAQVVVPVSVTASSPDAEFIVVTTTVPGHRPKRTVLPGSNATLDAGVRTVHSGDQHLLAVEAMAVGREGTWAMPAGTGELRARIAPHARTLRDLPVPRNPSGMSGSHDAPRPGEGGEFRDIHPFAPGDRLQRIDWKATARLARRPGDLYVRRMLATSDVDVAIVLDDGDDVTGVLGDWAEGDRASALPTSMDVAREAAWSIVSAYLERADQVSFQVLSRFSTAVPRGSGARHGERLLAAICGVIAQPRMLRRRTPIVPPNAMVVLISTFLDDEPLRLAGLWRAGGHRVLAIDSLPQLRSERMRHDELLASRVVLGARADRLAEVRALGADLLTWDVAAGTRAAELRAMTRQRRRG